MSKFYNYLKNKKHTNLSLHAVFPETKEFDKLKIYINNQNYLDKNKVNSIINLSFLKDFPIGYVLADKHFTIFGFLGTIFSNRKFGNKTCLHCYLHSWVVNENYRLQSYRLLFPILEKNCFISTFTPIPSLEGLYKKLEFKEVKFYSNFSIFLKFPFFSKLDLKIDIIKDFKNVLNSDLKVILEDHSQTKSECISLDFNNQKDEPVFLIIKKRFLKKVIPVIDLLYVSDKDKFFNYRNSIFYELFKKYKTIFFLEHFLEDEFTNLKSELFSKMTEKKVYYKNLPLNFKFDLLYSELLD